MDCSSCLTQIKKTHAVRENDSVWGAADPDPAVGQDRFLKAKQDTSLRLFSAIKTTTLMMINKSNTLTISFK